MDMFDILPLLFVIAIIALVAPVAVSYLIYEDVEYTGYIDNITFSGGGWASPDMVNIHFADGRIIRTSNSGDIHLKENCNVTLIIRDSLVFGDDLLTLKET